MLDSATIGTKGVHMSSKAYSMMIAGLMMMSAGAASACSLEKTDASARIQMNPDDTMVLVSGIEDKQAIEVAPSMQEESTTFAY
jgi:hypothetical protein